LTIKSITSTLKEEFEILTDVESRRTGLKNTTYRYMNLFKKSNGNIIVKSDDDVMYYDKWFESCKKVLDKDNKIGYISPISHQRMIKMGIKHAMVKTPIEPSGFNYEPVLSGMCWVFKRKLWEEIPYTLASDTWHLDKEYSEAVRKRGFYLAAIDGALISHMGQDRYKGVPTDCPGRMPSDDFKKTNLQTDFRVY
jgi:hypothetical protein